MSNRLKMRSFPLMLRPEILISPALVFYKKQHTNKFPKELEYKESYKEAIKECF
jgi:hypothetical protein